MTSTPTDVAADLDEATRLLSPKQLKSIAMSRRHTISLWVGAVSAGKTIASLFALLIAIVFAPKGELIVIIGQTLQTIERNVISKLQDPKIFGPIARLTVHTRNSGTAVILGRTVELIGAYNAAAESRIRGGTFGLVYVDEATLLPEEFWKMLITRLRVQGARMLATTNPASKNHWLRKEYVLRADVHDMIVFHFTMRDNPSLALSYVRRMMRSFTGVFYDRFILGLWTNAEGAVYDKWRPETHTIRWADMPAIRDVIGIGIDHGTSNASVAIMLGITDEVDERGRPRPRLIFLDEWRYDSKARDPETDLERPRMTNVEQSAAIRRWMRAEHIPENNPGHGLKPRPGFIFIDPAAADFREQMKRDRVANARADHDVIKGIQTLANLIGQNRILVTDRCAGFLEEITEYRWDPKKTEDGLDYPITENDHSLDAARYAVRSTRALWEPIMRAAYGLAA